MPQPGAAPNPASRFTVAALGGSHEYFCAPPAPTGRVGALGSFDVAMKVRPPISVLRRSARRGDQGYPIATVAFYGPDDKRASKVVLGIVRFEGCEPELEKWTSDTGDVRKDAALLQRILNRMREQGARSVVMPERIIGCPHEEGIDYPKGQACSQCDFWRGRNRFTGEYEL